MLFSSYRLPDDPKRLNGFVSYRQILAIAMKSHDLNSALRNLNWCSLFFPNSIQFKGCYAYLKLLKQEQDVKNYVLDIADDLLTPNKILIHGSINSLVDIFTLIHKLTYNQNINYAKIWQALGLYGLGSYEKFCCQEQLSLEFISELIDEIPSNKKRPTLIFKLSNSGFFSEIDILCLSLAFALAYDYQFLIDDSPWEAVYGIKLCSIFPALKKFTLDETNTSNISSNIVLVDRDLASSYWQLIRLWGMLNWFRSIPFASFFNQEFDLLSIKALLYKKLLIPSNEFLATIPGFDALINSFDLEHVIFVRLGDKIGRESLNISEALVDWFAKLPAKSLLLSDDTKQMAKMLRSSGNSNVNLYSPYETSGYDHNTFVKDNKETKILGVRNIIANFELLRRSVKCYGDSNCNLVNAAMCSKFQLFGDSLIYPWIARPGT